MPLLNERVEIILSQAAPIRELCGKTYATEQDKEKHKQLQHRDRSDAPSIRVF